ncbi:autotransporter outer membrane beta-barrel domain-containing protein [Shinella zoogloeoides]|uniref:Autotransporter domain-containing protein n=1 Tax=Shinella zoogloeoides TaxID=352475 RepID=A0A6N8TCT0_SHIZO|nr:autotransporter domain-containing protein [Shinella zoogloeoides]MXO01072.1 autotransporter domain-containing protein [Shinella zoogloeoides]UEX84111.1 autotransporter domain-containing protein [Shinella zoogloeoides]
MRELVVQTSGGIFQRESRIAGAWRRVIPAIRCSGACSPLKFKIESGRMSILHPGLRALSATALAGATWLGFVSSVHGQTWEGDLSGNWFDSGNWSTNSLPSAGFTAIIGNVGTSNAPVIEAAGASAGLLYIGGVPASGVPGASLHITDGGTLTSITAIIANSSNAQELWSDSEYGAVTVSGAGSQWTSNSIDVGFYGQGTLTVKEGGRVTSQTGMIGAISSGSGTVDVIGSGSLWQTTGQMVIGNEGDGTLNVSQGASVTNHAAALGYYAAGHGVANISGSGSQWKVTGANIVVGNLGTGELHISDGANVDTAYRTWIGSGANSSGMLTVAGAGSTLKSAIDVRIGVSSIGTTVVSGGGNVEAGAVYLGFNATGSGSLDVTGSNSRVTSAYGMIIGYFGDGLVTVGDGGTLALGPTIQIANKSGSSGTLNIGAAEGQAAAAAGGVQAGTLVFGAGAGELVFNHTDTGYNFAPKISGNGSIRQISGVTRLLGDSSGFTGTSTILGGAFVVNGKLGGSSTIGSGAFLGGVGTLGSAGSTLTVAGGGVHAPGNSIGVQTIAGNYINNGTLRIEATPFATDRVVVAGSVDISSAALDLAVSPGGGPGSNIFSTPFTIIEKTSAGAVSGPFLSVTQNLLFLEPLLDYAGGDGNDVTLRLQRNGLAFSGVGLTRNQVSTAAAVDMLDSASAAWQGVALAGGASAARAGFDVLSGEIHASAKTALIEDSRFLRNAMNDRLYGVFSDADVEHATIWSHGFGAWGHTSDDGNAARLTRSTGGLLMGGDMAALADWRFGAVAGYSHTRFDVAARGSSGASDNYHIGVYGGTMHDGFAFRTGAAYTWHEMQIEREVAIPGLNESLEAGYDAGTAQIFGEFGYGIEMDAGRFEPFGNLAHVAVNAHDFHEGGGSAALSGAGDTSHVTFSTLGLRVATTLELEGVAATVKGMAGWRHAFGGALPTSTHAFQGGGDFTVAGVPVARDAAIVEAGFDIALAPEAMLGLSYAAQFASDAIDQSLKARLDVRF